VPNPAGITSADALCAAEAKRAHLSGRFLALLGTSTAAASSRFDLSGAPWQRVDGALLADTADGLFTTAWQRNFIDREADGSFTPFVRVWGGDPTTATDRCGGWTATAGTTEEGQAWLTGPSLFVATAVQCADVAHHLLCLQE
jgi:hypothetical protein